MRSAPTSACARSPGAVLGRNPYEYVLLNGEPVYLRGALDQSFNPEGSTPIPPTTPSARDIQAAKDMGLNGLRFHIKPDEPRDSTGPTGSAC